MVINLRFLYSDQETQQGEISGDPAQRKVVPKPERDLGTVACAIVQLLLHAGFAWAASCKIKVYILYLLVYYHNR